MLAPYIIGLIGLIIIPAVLSLGLAFTRYDALTAPEWNGLANIIQLSNDWLFWQALRNTLIYVVFAVLLRIVGAFSLALLLQMPTKVINFSRAMIYLPSVIPDVAYVIIWLVALNPTYGLINGILSIFGISGPAWLVESWSAQFALIMMAGWQLGEGFVVLIASLHDIPTPLYETADIDGAGKWQKFWYITWPLILPRLLLLSARDTIISLQANFIPSLIMTKGGPGYATFYLPLYTYLLAFEDLRLGYASTVVWTLYLITGGVIAFYYLLGKRWQYADAFQAL